MCDVDTRQELGRIRRIQVRQPRPGRETSLFRSRAAIV